jgi:arylsulfatase A-like enzyme
MLIEFWQGFGSRALFDPAADLGRLLRYLPAQLALFTVIGLPLAALVRWSSASPSLVWWLRFGAALLMFLGPSAALGTFRDSRATLQAATSFASAGAAIALGLAVLAAPGRLLPRNLRDVWPAACAIGGSFLAVPLISRASAPLRLGSLGLRELPAMAQPSDWIAAFVVVVVVLTLGPARRFLGSRRARQAAATVAGILALVAADPGITRAESQSGRPDVIVILIDALRPDVLGAYGRSPSITPNLDAIASESVVFERAYAGGNRTARSMPLIMTSLSPAVVGESIAEEAQTLAEHLKQGGYATYGISANPMVSRFYGYAQGFDGFHDPTVAPDYLVMSPLQVLGRFLASSAYRWGLISAGLYYPTAAEIRSRASRILENVQRPLFLYLQTMDMHGPYLPPKRFLPADYRSSEFISYYDLLSFAGKEGLLVDPSHRPKVLNARQRYEGELRYTDEELGRLVAVLRRSDRWDEALVWIISDHGEAFGEHDWTGHAGFNVFSTLLRVPMILKPPRSSQIRPTVVDDPVSTADLLPTTLAILGFETPAQVFGVNLLDSEARSLRPPSRKIISDVHYPEGRLLSYVEGRWKLDALLPQDGGALESAALFDLSRDPLEQRNLLASRPEIVEPLEGAIAARLEAERRMSIRSRVSEPDADLVERLRSLGYVVE